MANEDVVIRIKSIADVSGVVNAITATDDLADTEKGLTNTTKTVEAAQGRLSTALNQRAGRTQRLTDEERRLNAATRSAAASITAETAAVTQSTGATNAAAAATRNLSNQKDRLSKSSQRSGQNMLQLAYFADDLQYGLRGIMNNIPGLIMALGGTAGLAGVLSIAAVALGGFLPMLLNLGDDAEEAGEKVDNSFKRTSESIDHAKQSVEEYKRSLDAIDESNKSLADGIKAQSTAIDDQIKQTERLAIASINLAKSQISSDSSLSDVDRTRELSRISNIEATFKGLNEVAKIQLEINRLAAEESRIRQQSALRSGLSSMAGAVGQAPSGPSQEEIIAGRFTAESALGAMGSTVANIIKEIDERVKYSADQQVVKPLEDLRKLLENFGDIDIASEADAYLTLLKSATDAIAQNAETITSATSRTSGVGGIDTTITSTIVADVQESMRTIEQSIAAQKALSDMIAQRESAEQIAKERAERDAEERSKAEQRLTEIMHERARLEQAKLAEESVNVVETQTRSIESAAKVEAEIAKEENAQLKAANEGLKAQMEGQQSMMQTALGNLIKEGEQSPLSSGKLFSDQLRKLVDSMKDGLNSAEQKELSRLIQRAAQSNSEFAASTARAITELNKRIRETDNALLEVKTNLKEGFR